MPNRAAWVLPLLLAAACGSKSDDKGGGAKAGDPKAGRGAFKLDDITQAGDDGIEVAIDRRDVPLHEMGLSGYFGGLPLSGMADVAIDLKVPKVDGAEDFRQAKGTIALACPNSCQIGDDATKLRLGKGDMGAMGELSFGHLLFDRFELQLDVADGKGKLSKWSVESKDVTLEVSLEVAFGKTLNESRIEGCLRFRPSEDLAKRDPKTATVLSATGATRGADGMFTIKLGGTVGHRKAIAAPCGSS
ncbi:MAG: hypothetical protein KF773_35810 [Deltaproteobacteria bacterium]|nr:hypothetical protein [Deltaproteobacteria bacterium]MCW5804884.1 hypothetical protein [Deltaproteobacteria bacterium]